jgi:hypothetical protein
MNTIRRYTVGFRSISIHPRWSISQFDQYYPNCDGKHSKIIIRRDGLLTDYVYHAILSTTIACKCTASHVVQ